jgi:tagatose-6-phosphate ketose/aldose isomerase
MTISEKVDSSIGAQAGSITWSEIQQQPELWNTTLDRVKEARKSMPEFPAGRSIVTGAGTSAYAAAAIAEAGTGMRAIPTTDLLSISRLDLLRTVPDFENEGVLLSLARSGNSPESLAVIDRVSRLFPKVRHAAITCNAEGRLAQIDHVKTLLLDPRTNDRSLVMTSSFSNLVLAGIALLHFDEVKKHLKTICRRATDLLPLMQEKASEVVSVPAERAVVLASRPMFALARETALKILEMTAGRVTAIPETYLGLRHGPMSYLREDTLVLCLVSNDALTCGYEADLVAELQNKGLGRVIAVGPPEFSTGAKALQIPAVASELADHLRTPFEILFGQILGYHLSLKAGLDPDQPSPAGVITRVVPEFRIYEGQA